jgi:hypothetical protein
MITGDRGPHGVWESHYHGQITLLKLRGKAQLETKVGRSLFAVVQNQLLMWSFLGSFAPVKCFAQWYHPGLEWSLTLDFGVVLHRIAYFNATVRKLIEASSPLPAARQRLRLISIISQGVALDDELCKCVEPIPRDWVAQQPEEWLRNWMHRKQGPVEGFENSLSPIWEHGENCGYVKMAGLVTWNQYRCIRIHLLQTLCDAGALIFPTPESMDINYLLTRWRSIIVETAEDIINSVTDILGINGDTVMMHTSRGPGRALRGYALLWPLRAVISVDELGSERKRWVAQILRQIGQDVGQAIEISKLVKVADDTTPLADFTWLDSTERHGT